ncbi:GNAT family N-acetyltransferase [Saccharopolyspora erythraea]|uniref:GNAT family N-acetyltransferase n=1 Tax=Saccharopolyspora erythraea TaxID=1836 RepID=UPI001BA457B5|nr:GNAT family N-acetyltransferase [Saccharopolyspora erythraea]QUH00626.1 GNAT family N-acetyltransferase [Saccharopolyspora erythraea]
MSRAQELLDAQGARFAALDPWLPGRYLLPRGEPIMARIPGGEAVAGLVAHTRHEPGSQQSLWQALDTFELFPVVGERPRTGMDALLTAWRAQLAQHGAPSTDSSCVVMWPSRDVEATRTLLDHGFAPLSVLAVRPPSPEPEAPNTKLSGTVKIRRAGPADLDAVVELTLAELDYAALVGASTRRPNARELKRGSAGVRLHAGDPVWLAELDGRPVAVAECGWFDTERHEGGHRLRPGRWAYVNCVSVRDEARGTGIGRELMAVAHEEFARAGTVGSFLYYNPPNPLSSVFWPRQGYRPLWTMWEVRPATALR